jgi:hypothetical protein
MLECYSVYNNIMVIAPEHHTRQRDLMPELPIRNTIRKTFYFQLRSSINEIINRRSLPPGTHKLPNALDIYILSKMLADDLQTYRATISGIRLSIIWKPHDYKHVLRD